MLDPVLKERFIQEIFQYSANPSSFHQAGIEVQKKMTGVKARLADQIRCQAQELYFTSGGTECNNLALRGVLAEGDHVITSTIEHPSIRHLLQAMGKNIQVTALKTVNEQSLLEAIRPNTRLVTLMHVNNETGQIFDVDKLYKTLREKGILLHRDAVQSLLKVPFDVRNCDLASFSAHKVGALKGLGILFKRKGVALKPFLWGGEQQQSLRPGTENVPGILALGQVLEAKTKHFKEHVEKVQAINHYLREHLSEHTLVLSPPDASPFILSLSVVGLPSEVVLNALSAKEIYVSAGSACSSKSQHKSYVIEQLTEDESVRKGVLRLSFSDQNTMDEAQRFVYHFQEIVRNLRKVIR